MKYTEMFNTIISLTKQDNDNAKKSDNQSPVTIWSQLAVLKKSASMPVNPFVKVVKLIRIDAIPHETLMKYRNNLKDLYSSF